MKIIAHRGAGGKELENSLSSLRTALKLDVDAVEFDIHRTSDNVLVVMHDGTTGRTASENVHINQTSFTELQAIELHNGQQVPTLEAVLALTAGRPIYIDIKDEGCAELLMPLLQKYPKVHATFVSYLGSELRKIRELSPQAKTYIYFRKSDYYIPRPFKMVRTALGIGATGIAIDKLFLNPMLYAQATRNGLKMYVYSINTLGGARMLAKMYPEIGLCTNHPELLNRHFKPKLEAGQ